MAGQDMSKNLGGMLSQTAGALGTMGSSYSDSLVRNIENMSRPDAASDDLAAQQKLMAWQNNMGRSKEAAVTDAIVGRLEAKAEREEEKELDASRADELMKAQAIVDEANAAVVSGDMAGLSSRVTEFNALMQEAKERGDFAMLAELNQVKSGFNSIAARTEARANNITTDAAAALNISDSIASGQLPPEKEATAQARLDTLLADPETKLAFEQVQLERTEMKARQKAAAFQEAAPQINNEIVQATGDPDALNKVLEKYSDFPEVRRLINDSIATQELIRETKANNAEVDYKGAIALIDESNLPDEMKQTFRGAIERAESETALLPKSRRAKVAGIMQQVLSQELAVSTRKENEESDTRIRQEVYIEELTRSSSVGPSSAEVRSFAKSFAEDPKSITDDELAEAEGMLIEESAERLKRERIRLGDLPPMDEIPADYDEVVMESVDTLGVEETIEQLVREGYSEEAVKTAILKNVNKQLASRAQVEALVPVIAEKVRYEDSVYRDAEPASRSSYESGQGQMGRVRPASGPSRGERARAKLAAEPFEMPELTPFNNKLADAREKQNQGRGFDYTQSSLLDLFQGDLTKRKR